MRIEWLNDMQDLRALCRVFLADENRPSSGKCIANIDVKISINLGSKTVSNVNNRGQVSTSELLVSPFITWCLFEVAYFTHFLMNESTWLMF